MNKQTSFNFNALRDRIVELLYEDFPKEFLAKLTPTAEADWKQRRQEFTKDNPGLEGTPPAMPDDNGSNYVAVTRRDSDADDFVKDQGHTLTDLTQSRSGVEFEALCDPTTETKVWLSIDECPEEIWEESHWDDPAFTSAPTAAPVIRDERERLSREETRQLRDAVRFGGVEFIRDLLDHAQEVYRLAGTNFSSEFPPPPDPIDPDKFG